MRVTPQHWEVFLSIAEKHPCLITSKFNGAQGKQEGHALWANIATKLNGLGLGKKTVTGWRKTVTDWKCKVKSKAAKLRQHTAQTGGRSLPSDIPPLSPLEVRLIGLMAKKGSWDDEGVGELGTANNPRNILEVSVKGIASASKSSQSCGFGNEQEVLIENCLTVNDDWTSASSSSGQTPEHKLLKYELSDYETMEKIDIVVTRDGDEIISESADILHNQSPQQVMDMKSEEDGINSKHDEENVKKSWTARRRSSLPKRRNMSSVSARFELVAENKIELINLQKKQVQDKIDQDQEEHNVKMKILKLQLRKQELELDLVMSQI